MHRMLWAVHTLRAFDPFHTIGEFCTLHTVDNLCTFCIPTGFLMLSAARSMLLLAGCLILAPCGLTPSILEQTLTRVSQSLNVWVLFDVFFHALDGTIHR